MLHAVGQAVSALTLLIGVDLQTKLKERDQEMDEDGLGMWKLLLLNLCHQGNTAGLVATVCQGVVG